MLENHYDEVFEFWIPGVCLTGRYFKVLKFWVLKKSDLMWLMIILIWEESFILELWFKTEQFYMHRYQYFFPKESPSWALLAICSQQSSCRGKQSIFPCSYLSTYLSMAGQRCPVLWTPCCWDWPCTTRCSSWPRWWWSGCPASTHTAPTWSTPRPMTGQKSHD